MYKSKQAFHLHPCQQLAPMTLAPGPEPRILEVAAECQLQHGSVGSHYALNRLAQIEPTWTRVGEHVERLKRAPAGRTDVLQLAQVHRADPAIVTIRRPQLVSQFSGTGAAIFDVSTIEGAPRQICQMFGQIKWGFITSACLEPVRGLKPWPTSRALKERDPWTVAVDPMDAMDIQADTFIGHRLGAQWKVRW
ncbi:hypothetical protein [Ralstonia chuxiongensis]|uniref:hypothetical protein n=1 Tax=Ralstonia chuxiongensis TaxID=2957504 RepID=UPI00293072C5|nr:hypothetical protein [Ralstonia chuxiongensis]